ncbi:glycosyltransferase [Acetobacter sp. AN02]|uniref:glycosyltransferase n=1 Tax=Acetobacter sp. AN02 TaxID=2894186 RepID=UPI0024341F41|nr:glycosyltransferase [Acetobacter sp. AN02]MDG6094310.1 glycosyltransferase [Acetobacter sp. AN02]
MNGTEAVSPQITIVVPVFREAVNIRPLVQELEKALDGRSWEVVFVDDNSPDGTISEIRDLARSDARVRGLRRIGRRGLSGAVIEGALSSSAEFIAVMDGDLQHDETRLGTMIDAVASGSCDIAVGSRHVEGGDNAGLAGAWRHMLSDSGIRLARFFLPVQLNDPMSGFFVLRQSFFDAVAPRLSGQGFKILLDVILSAPAAPAVREIPCVFRPRLAGESKLDILVLFQFLGLFTDRIFRGWLPVRFLTFATVGAVGIGVNLGVMSCLNAAGMALAPARLCGTLTAMVSNYLLDNTFTFRDRRLKGVRFLAGLAGFMLVSALGLASDIGVSRLLYTEEAGHWHRARAAGALAGVVWNYAVSSVLIWRMK